MLFGLLWTHYSKNQSLLRNHIIPNSATVGVQEPQGLWSGGSWTPNDCRLAKYAISQWVWDLALSHDHGNGGRWVLGNHSQHLVSPLISMLVIGYITLLGVITIRI